MNKEGIEFNVRDRSVLLPLYARWLWDPLTNALPTFVTPNAITLVANAFAGLAYWLLLTRPHGGTHIMALIAIANFIYFTLDNIDGRQARRTNTCSRLGEFLDHWFDAWNLGLLVVCVCLFFELRSVICLSAMFACSLGFFMTYWEQYRTGCVQLGYIGPNEGLTAVSILFAVGAIAGEALLVQPLVFGLSTLDIFCLLMSLGFIGVVLATAWRNSGALTDVLGLALGHGLIILCYLAGVLTMGDAGMLMLFLHVSHTGRVISCRLTQKTYSPFLSFDLCVLVGGLALATLLATVGLRPTAVAATAMLLGGRLMIDALTTLFALRRHDQAATLCKAS